MGEEILGKLFVQVVGSEKYSELKPTPEGIEAVQEYMDENLRIIREASLELTLDVAPTLFGDKRISQKRFRKLLYSGGYGRNDANEIIKCEQSKGYYLLSDVEYWNKYKEIFENE